MLANPGKTIKYNGKTIKYPEIDLVYWAGGNSFVHHQDINALLSAWRKPTTIIVHDMYLIDVEENLIEQMKYIYGRGFKRLKDKILGTNSLYRIH